MNASAAAFSLDLGCCGRCWWGPSVYLVGIENRIDTGDERAMLLVSTCAGWGGLGVVALGENPFHDLGRSFALADLGAEVGPLPVGRPHPVGCSASIACNARLTVLAPR